VPLSSSPLPQAVSSDIKETEDNEDDEKPKRKRSRKTVLADSDSDDAEAAKPAAKAPSSPKAKECGLAFTVLVQLKRMKSRSPVKKAKKEEDVQEGDKMDVAPAAAADAAAVDAAAVDAAAVDAAAVDAAAVDAAAADAAAVDAAAVDAAAADAAAADADAASTTTTPTTTTTTTTTTGANAWAKGDKVPYDSLAKAFEAIEQTTKRLKIADILSDYFRLVIDLTPEDLLPSVYLCVNRVKVYSFILLKVINKKPQLAPEFEGIELGIGESLLMKAISNATGRTTQAIKADLETVGDLGEIAQASRATQKTMFQPAKLSVRQVFKTLKEIAQISGNQSMQKKVEKIQSLLVACRGNEAKYLIRSLEGKMRIGLAEQTVLVALAQACVISQKYKPSQHVALDKNEKLNARVQEAIQSVKQVYRCDEAYPSKSS